MTNPRVPFVLADERPPLAPPQGKPLIVHVVVNVESWPFDSAMPRKLLTAPHGLETVPDVPNFSWAEYGLRAGMPRLFKLLAEREIAGKLLRLVDAQRVKRACPRQRPHRTAATW